MNPKDIQGLVVRGYGRMAHARYVLLRFSDDPSAVRRWLSTIVSRVDDAVPKETGPTRKPAESARVRLNIAFTFQGLEKLGLAEDTLNTFPFEFAEGLGVPWKGTDPDHRSRILGDTGDSCPANWDWGYQGDNRIVHALLLAFSDDENALNQQVVSWIQAAREAGAIADDVERVLPGRFRIENRRNTEPFGFADGISQPVLKSATARTAAAGESLQPRAHEVEDGEIVLGYRDGAGTFPASPSVAAEEDPFNLLRAATPLNGVDRHDLGFNSTFLVFRQMSQDVNAFEKACEDASQSMRLNPDYVGALIVGRWKDGSPLIGTPIAPDPRLAQLPAANDFVYGDDPDGKRCPLGAHIRRSNPRDSLNFGAATSLQIAQRHRILRRGRPYETANEVGLHFICLNASISRQFEFVQQNWINEPTFGGLNGEVDPLIGERDKSGVTNGFTIPPSAESLLPRPLEPLKRFVSVRGGGYFWLPSLSALHFLTADASALKAKHPHMDWPTRPEIPTLSDKLRLLALARVPLLSAVVLLGVPFANLAPAPVSAMLGPTFDLDHWWEMLAVSTLTSLAAIGSLLTFRMLQLYAWARFKVRTIVKPITWGRVLLQQAISLPIVGWAWFRSSRDAMTGVSGSAVWSYLRFGVAAVAGFLLAFLFIRLAAAVHAKHARSRSFVPVLLPAGRIETRLERTASWLLGVARWIVSSIEGLAAGLMPETTSGYVDRQGRLLPGHLTMLAFFLVLAALYAAGWFLLRPIGLQFPFGLGHIPAPGRYQVPPLGYLAFAVLVIGLAASSATFLLDKYRVPLLSVLVGWFAFASFTAGTDHQFEVSPNFLAPPPSAGVISRPEDNDPIVIIAAAGGGIRQTVWTTQVLTGLTKLWPQFPQRVALVSAVSGGSLGALYFVNGYGEFYAHAANQAVRDPTADLQKSIVHASATSGSGDIWWGLTYPDSARALFAFFPTLFFPRTWDRGWALERAWAHALGYTGKAEPTLGNWREKTATDLLPAVAFNATVVETGERALFATFDPLENAAPVAEGVKRSTQDANALTCDHDLSVVTAARLSAAFPYVTPNARAQSRSFDSQTTDATAWQKGQHHICPDGMLPHLADGGYWDNFGVVTALDWLRAARTDLANRRVLLVQIEPGPELPPPVHDRAWVWQATSPLATLLSVRTNAQRARNDEDIRALQDRWNGDKPPGEPGTLSTARIVDTGEKPTLGWHLSLREQADVERVWRCGYATNNASAVMASLARLFGTRRDAPGTRDKDCQP